MNADLFDEGSIEVLHASWVNVLRGMVQSQEQRVGELALMTADRRADVVEVFNVMEAAYPSEATVHGLFERGAPNAGSIGGGVGSAAAGLRHAEAAGERGGASVAGTGGEAGRPGGLRGARNRPGGGHAGNPEVGCGATAIGPGYPKERLRWMLSEQPAEGGADPRRGSECAELAGGIGGGGVGDAGAGGSGARPAGGGTGIVEPCDVIYTSGSTGRPKER